LVRGDADVLILAVDDRGRRGALGELEVVAVVGRERQRDAAVDELPLLGRVVPGADAAVVLVGHRGLDVEAGGVDRRRADRRGVRDVGEVDRNADADAVARAAADRLTLAGGVRDRRGGRLHAHDAARGDRQAVVDLREGFRGDDVDRHGSGDLHRRAAAAAFLVAGRRLGRRGGLGGLARVVLTLLARVRELLVGLAVHVLVGAVVALGLAALRTRLGLGLIPGRAVPCDGH